MKNICIGQKEKEYMEGKLANVDNVFRCSKSMRVLSQVYKLSRGYVEREVESGDSHLGQKFPTTLPKSLTNLNNSLCSC